MGKRARIVCMLDNKRIDVGSRSLHLVEVHKLMPPKKWLEKHRLPEDLKAITDAMKRDRNLRPPYGWIYEYFDFPKSEQVS